VRRFVLIPSLMGWAAWVLAAAAAVVIGCAENGTSVPLAAEGDAPAAAAERALPFCVAEHASDWRR
jgi:hypothetical protein